MTKPRVFYIMATFGRGGPQSRIVDLINAFGESYEHTLSALDDQYASADRLATPVQIINSPGIHRRLRSTFRRLGSLRMPLVFIAFIWAAFRWYIVIKRVRPDLVFANGFGSLVALLPLFLVPRIPVLYSEDGILGDEIRGRKKRRIFIRYLITRRSARVIVPSESLRDIAIDEYQLPMSQVLYIPNGVDCNRFKPGASEELRANLGIAPTDFLVGTVGSLTAVKNHKLLIEAFAGVELFDTKLMIVGGRSDGQPPEVVRVPSTVASRVIFTGPIADTSPFYRAIDLFVLSSVTEQMPIALLEAMASGLPVVVTNVGDCAALVATSNPIVLVASGDVGALRDALLFWRTHHLDRVAWGKRNRLLCERRFSLQAMIDRYRRVVEAALYQSRR